MKVLYISYDGMTDPLGQSQVLPYLCGLSQKGCEITLLSCEKKENFKQQANTIKAIVKAYNIDWQYITYTKRPAVLSTIWDVFKLKTKAFKLSKQTRFDIVHCRSYIASLVGLQVKKAFNSKFIFDMRGFWADERVDGNLWNLNNPLYKKIYQYFKQKEHEFLANADYVISLTDAAKVEIEKNILPGTGSKIQVIPCCADIMHFSKENTKQSAINHFRKKLGIAETDFILTYLGSIGTWYMLPEMLDFFNLLIQKHPDAKFLFITAEDPLLISNVAIEKEIDLTKLIIYKATRAELPNILSLTDLSIFFIKPSYSKIASSPTKMAELLSMGIPVVCNAGVGDNDKIMRENNVGKLVTEFNKHAYLEIINNLKELVSLPVENMTSTAHNLFSLRKGVSLYEEVYKKLTSL